MSHQAPDPGARPPQDRGAVIPARWEWRSFDYRPELWNAAIGADHRAQSGTLGSETYLLLPGLPANAKIRDGILDVKRLVRRGPGGLEQWQPVFKHAFPLSAACLGEFLTACAVSGDAPPEGGCATPEALFALLRDRMPDLRVVPVRKWRRHYDVEGCIAERSTVLAGGATLETLAFEHEDPESLQRVLARRGLDGSANTNYPAALAMLVSERGQ